GQRRVVEFLLCSRPGIFVGMLLSFVFFPAGRPGDFRVAACRSSDGISAESSQRRRRGRYCSSDAAVDDFVFGGGPGNAQAEAEPVAGRTGAGSAEDRKRMRVLQ